MEKKQQKILVVDDERLNINVLVDLLKPDYKMMFAKSGPQALKAVQKENPPDLVLLDIMMPEMDGYEVCRRIKADEKTRDIPIIFVTAMGEIGDETKGLELGAVDYLTKPISPPIVQARVKTQLDRKRQRDELKAAYEIIEYQKERMQKELDVGRDIQMSMVPRTFPAFPDRDEFSIHAVLNPAREVGGDFYDFFFVDEDRLCFCVGDVSGKGVPAALFMAVTRTLIKANAEDDLSTASIVTRVNEELVKGNTNYMFVTLFTGILNLITGELVYTNAGHNPSYILRAENDPHSLKERHGPVIGALEGLTYKETTIQLSAGDTLFMYTDGITEAHDHENQLFGDKRLFDFLISKENEDLEKLIPDLVTKVNQFEGKREQFDDITIMALRYQKKPDETCVQLKMSITNDLSQIGEVKEKFNTFSEENNLSTTIRRKLNLVFDELLNNIISYAYDDDKNGHNILINIESIDKKLTITISDGGIPFNPFTGEKPDITIGLEDRKVGGLGIHLVRSLMDKAFYKRRVDKNIVTLIKYFDDDKSDGSIK
jgi:sigma-B regulation protein RsbU (phosphoserine phosphatase)